MKIVKEDQNIMILKERRFFAFLIGAFFILVGLFIIFKPGLFESGVPMYAGIAFALVGLLVIFTNKTTVIAIDKTTGKIILQWKNLFGKKLKEYSLSAVKQIEFQEFYTKTKNGYERKYRLAFILDNGEAIPLTPYGSLTFGVMGMEMTFGKTIGTKIASFLNIPFQERRPTTFGEALSAIKDAVQKGTEKDKQD